jgi:hypothetical protein
MEIKCENCDNWTTRKTRVYDDGTEITDFEAEDGKGQCCVINAQTAFDFYCAKFMSATGDHVERQLITGAPWQNFKMIPCPDCNGRGSGINGGVCQRCMGTANVRQYDDGYIGEEKTRRHPNEPEVAAQVDPGTILAPMEKPSLTSEQ